jgi:hypothetical protein
MKNVLFAILFFGAGYSVSAQGNQNGGSPSFADRIYFGGGGSLNGGTNSYNFYRYFTFSVNPLVGYKITSSWSAGIGVNYTMINYPDIKVRLNQYGVSPFTRYNFGKLFTYAEYSVISVPAFDNSFRRTYKRFPLGLGYSMPLGDKAAINAMALYDLLYDRRDGAFASPWIFRVFFTAGRLSF